MFGRSSGSRWWRHGAGLWCWFGAQLPCKWLGLPVNMEASLGSKRFPKAVSLRAGVDGIFGRALAWGMHRVLVWLDGGRVRFGFSGHGGELLIRRGLTVGRGRDG